MNNEQRNMLNLILNNTPADVVTLDLTKLDEANRVRRAAEDAAAPKPEENDALRAEYLELHRRLEGQATTKAWKAHADAEQAKHRGIIKQIEVSIEHLKGLLKSPGLRVCRMRREGRTPLTGCGCDGCVFQREIESLEHKLHHQLVLQERSIKANGASIANARELDKLRPRYSELHAMFSAIDEARKSIRGITNKELAPEQRTMGDHFHQKSRHLRWEPSDNV